MSEALQERLVGIIRATPELMAAFRTARALDLPDWWIVSGALYGAVWNALTGRPALHGVKDIDLFYFDPDTSWAAEDRVIRRAAPFFAPAPPVEIRNQARVPLWYRDRFGHACPDYASSREGIDHFASRTHCVGMRLRPDDGFDIYAPYGLEDVFAMRVVPNPILPNRATHEAKATRQKACWPELTIEPWPEALQARHPASPLLTESRPSRPEAT
ncbi:MAG: nucleotidyltransferase family protein [Limimaricola soesokkakensis]|uniref:nucleotidyltransferase family protein n=1 Tax=Limimaricola soesokkakensis TaxID=1343159 RepID=UPI004059D16C